MAYIPPHKRHSKDAESSSPRPELLIPQFHKNLNLRSSGSRVERRKDKHPLQGEKFMYANDAISKWAAIVLADDSHFPSSTRLVPISTKSIEEKYREPPLVLVLDDRITKEKEEVQGDVLKSPWESIAEHLQEDLLSSFQNLREVVECQDVVVKPSLVARFGKILFHGSPSVSLETARSSVAETTIRQLKRTFYTNVPLPYRKYVTEEAMPKIGLDFEGEKEVYHVKLSDSVLPDSIISCKCRVIKDCKKLEFYKIIRSVNAPDKVVTSSLGRDGVLLLLTSPPEPIELNQVRHLVLDLSCLDRKLDLRLMLCTKRVLTALTDDEQSSIRSLINSAVLDPEVKGGLRWSLGSDCSGDRYTVVGVWHTNSKTFRNSSIRVKVRHADRFNFKTSVGEVTGEVNLKMTGIVSQFLQEQNLQIDQASKMLKDNIKLIWDCFLS